MKVGPSVELYGWLQKWCPDELFYRLTKELDPFRRVVRAGAWLHPRQRTGPVTVVSLKVFEECTHRSFKEADGFSVRALVQQFPFLSLPQALDGVCGLVRATCLVGGPTPPQYVVTFEPAPYLADDQRKTLKEVCYREAEQAARCVAVGDHNKDVRALLMHNVAGLLFNYTAPHLGQRHIDQANPYKPAVGCLDIIVVLGTGTTKPDQVLFWEA
ncbi:MAG: hypothetical protein U0514_01915 [Candidatus Andersenbacteria bacterium]